MFVVVIAVGKYTTKMKNTSTKKALEAIKRDLPRLVFHIYGNLIEKYIIK